MNHQVEDYVDICATWLEGCYAHRFDEERFVQDIVQSHQYRIETLQMSDLEYGSVLFGQCDQFVGFFDCDGDRLLDQNMHSGGQEVLCNAVMELGGNYHAYGVNQPNKFAMVAVGLGTECRRNVCRPLRIVIHHSDQFNAIDHGIFLGMEVSQVTYPNDSRSEGAHPRQIPRLEFSINANM